MRWRLYIEEYLPELQYIKGTHNVVADALGLMECFGLKQPNEIDSTPLTSNTY
jgi:hypothetical protein